ncbi:MAG: phage tail family protein [Clostridium sp.]
MDKKYINLKFQSNNQTLMLQDDYKLIKIEGIEASDYEIVINNYTQNDGGYINKKRVLPRDISILFDYCNLKNDGVERQNIIKFFNPKSQGILTVNYCGVERYIIYEIESFKEGRVSLHEPLSFNLNLICPDPYFKDIILGETIATFIGGWKFKFKLPFRFKQKGEPKKNIFNDGHVETPVEIIFKGPAVNPSIINHATGEFIKVERTLTTDDTLYITTEFGNKKVEIERNGVRQNAFHYIDLDSTFFQLQPGDNMIEYTTANELEPQSVEIRYRNRYIGV